MMSDYSKLRFVPSEFVVNMLVSWWVDVTLFLSFFDVLIDGDFLFIKIGLNSSSICPSLFFIFSFSLEVFLNTVSNLVSFDSSESLVNWLMELRHRDWRRLYEIFEFEEGSIINKNFHQF